MKKPIKVILTVLLTIIIIFLVSWGIIHNNQAASPVSGQPIKIGWIGVLSGDMASLGNNAKAATEIALAEVNAAGGINGRSLELIYEDGKCNAKDAVNAANKLFNIDQVPIIIGGLCSSETSGFVKSAMEQKKLVFSYCSSSPDLSNSGEYFFRNYPSDSFQGEYAAKYAYNDLGKRKVAILFVQETWGFGVKNVFSNKFKDLGGEIVSEETFKVKDKDLKTQLNKIKKAQPDLVYFLAYSDETAIGLRQAQELGLNLQFLGGDSWDDPTLWQKLGYIGEGAQYTKPFSPLSDHFNQAMKQKIGKDEVLICSPGAYDAIKILAQAMNNVGTDPAKIKDYLHNMNPYFDSVVAENISFDKNGDIRVVRINLVDKSFIYK